MRIMDTEKILSGNRRALAKAITLVESSLEHHRLEAQHLLESLLPHTGNSIRIGISGTPGVGKSTFIEVFGLHLIELGKKVAVLAVDPSSPVAGGSILGDKTRMEALSRHCDAFIRPSPSSGQLGGVALRTREALLLCESAGFDVVLVETVGVGQSEFDVAGMVDFFLVLMQPNAGDELQGIKKGIMELADALVVNKADGESLNAAEKAGRNYSNALALMAQSGFWQPRVMTCSALEQRNVDGVWDMVCEYQKQAQDLGEFDKKRAEQSKAWMNKLLFELITHKLETNTEIKALRARLEKQVVEGETTPLVAAKQISDLI